ncbi:hypothetical protein E4U57_002051 [Claviceps arundinis]|uniref:Mitochondrial import inner membrane translocase subunit TIM50 n=1 Tax=Claviceps arundinis TaxID=1623583 RepID=A0A9P7MT02_9HYPO|nr:hypothetical protein E4U57_002051 [Claviceps arundinis]KAG5968727.1 hypothetical protein E4U56_000270 [Claviceps arundinis]
MSYAKLPPYLSQTLFASSRLARLSRPIRPFSRPLDLSQRHNNHIRSFSNDTAPRSASTAIYDSLLTTTSSSSPISGAGTASPRETMQLSSTPTALDALADSFMPAITTSSKSPSRNEVQARSTSQTDKVTSKARPKPRRKPSDSSGGVPCPSPIYLKQADFPPTMLSSPRRILVVLDLNGTLLFRPSRQNPTHFVQRPHAKTFLQYCLETYHVAIWSSAQPKNVKSMVTQLLTPAQREQCVVIWARDRLGLSVSDYGERVQVYKRLSGLWSDPEVMASHPNAVEGGRWDQTNTVLVDDSTEKGRSEPYNILAIPEFAGLQAEPANVLPQVHDYLNHLCYQSDTAYKDLGRFAD